jgi:hypothetical protein
MPTKNPRLTITLQPALAAQLRRLSELTGNSQSALIAELLEGSGPVFDRMIQVLEAADTVKQSIKGKVADDMQQAAERIDESLGLVFEGFDSLDRFLMRPKKSIAERLAQSGREASRRVSRQKSRQRRALPVLSPLQPPYLTGGSGYLNTLHEL